MEWRRARRSISLTFTSTTVDAYAFPVDADTVIANGVLAAQRWLENAETHPAAALFDWHGFAEAAATLAHGASSITDADAWAAVSVRAYERLSLREEEPRLFELSAMNLRAAMIQRFGTCDGHLVRDVKILVEWFRRTAMPIHDAKRVAQELRSLPPEQWSKHVDRLRPLRALKNRISVFRALDDPPSDVVPWLDLWSLLP